MWTPNNLMCNNIFDIKYNLYQIIWCVKNECRPRKWSAQLRKNHWGLKFSVRYRPGWRGVWDKLWPDTPGHLRVVRRWLLKPPGVRWWTRDEFSNGDLPFWVDFIPQSHFRLQSSHVLFFSSSIQFSVDLIPFQVAESTCKNLFADQADAGRHRLSIPEVAPWWRASAGSQEWLYIFIEWLTGMNS